MTISMDDLLSSILESLDRIDYIKPEDIPNIDLYMDQVTTFMDKKLKSSTRYPDEDKILTKTMINNYAKNKLLPSPERKKYSKEHILVLIFIYYFKGILSIGDIQTLLSPIMDRFFKSEKGLRLEDVYEEVFSLEKEQIDVLKKDVVRKFEIAQGTFEEAEEEAQEFLKQFAFICMLSFDVYTKKLLIEKMIDGMNGSFRNFRDKDVKKEKGKEKEKERENEKEKARERKKEKEIVKEREKEKETETE